MKITLDREAFQTAFSTAASVAPAKSPKPVLQNVLMQVTPGATTLLASDLEVSIRIDLPDVEVEKPGSVLLPAGRVGSILRESTDSKISIDAKPNGITIRGDRSKFELPAIDPDEFPLVATFEEGSYLELPARLFREMIRRTAFATDTQSSRYALGGALFEITDDKLLGVATDGRRLAKMEGPASWRGGREIPGGNPIIPARSLQLMERAFTDGDALIQFAPRMNDVVVRGGNTTIFARLVEGRFPRWRDVVPDHKSSPRSVELTVGPLLSILKQAAIMASAETRGIDWSFDDGTLTVQAATADMGESRSEMPVAWDHKPLGITLDSRYALDLLKVLDLEKTLTLHIKDSDSPALFLTDDGYAYVIMPLAREKPKR